MRVCVALALGVLALPVWAEGLPYRASTAPPVRAEPPAPPVCALPEMAPVAGLAEEHAFTVDGQTLRAIVTRPADTDARAVAVLLHGYQGSRDEFPIADGGGLFERTAATMARAGIATVRFDFRGSGVSDGDWADTTLASQTEDTLAVIAALSSVEDLPGPAHLLGFSQGGLVALQAAAAQDTVASVTLWNPVLDPFQTYGRIFGDGAVQAGISAARSGNPETPIAGTGLKAGFFGEINLSDPMSSAAAYPGPILIVAGRTDRLAGNGPGNAQKLAAQRNAPTRIEVVEAGHTLGGTGGTRIVDRAIACSVAFMLRNSAAAEREIPTLQ